MAIFLSTIPNLSTSMRVNGAVYRIQFVPRDRPYNNGILAVGEETYIRAIRQHPYFGTIITELVEDNVTPPKEETKTYLATYPEVTKSQDAKEILINQYAADANTLKTKMAIKEAAERINIHFPNLV